MARDVRINHETHQWHETKIKQKNENNIPDGGIFGNSEINPKEWVKHSP